MEDFEVARTATHGDPPPRIPERHKKPGVCYTVTDDGIELPVVDVTHSASALDPSPSELAANAEESLRGLRHWARLPVFARRLAARHSVLMRGGGSMSDCACRRPVPLGVRTVLGSVDMPGSSVQGVAVSGSNIYFTAGVDLQVLPAECEP
jgi:hypothetical protein